MQHCWRGLAAGSIVFDIVFSTFNFLRSGTTGLVAQAFGRGDALEERAVLLRAVSVSLAIGIALALVAPAISLSGAWFMAAEPRVLDAMDVYVRIRLLGAPFALANYVILGYVLGRGEGRLGLLLQLVLNGANIALAIVLGLELGWGVAGVAWGAVGGELIGLLVGLAVLALRFRNSVWPSRVRVFDTEALLSMMTLNRDIMIRSFVLLAAFALFTASGRAAGHADARRECSADQLLPGRRLFPRRLCKRGRTARRPRDRCRKRARLSQGDFDHDSLGLRTVRHRDRDISDLRQRPGGRDHHLARTCARRPIVYIPWAAFTAVSGVLAFQMDGVFIGATWSRDMRNMMLLSVRRLSRSRSICWRPPSAITACGRRCTSSC